MTVLTRAYASKLELRDDGRTIVGIAVPYGQETRIGRYVESFAPGAFADVPAPTPSPPPTHATEQSCPSVTASNWTTCRTGSTAPGTSPTPTPATTS